MADTSEHDKTPTDEHHRPEDSKPTGPVRHHGDNKATGPARMPGRGKRSSTGPSRNTTTRRRAGGAQTGQRKQKQRATGIFSLEPPSRNRGPRLGRGGTRLDAMDPGKTKQERNESLFGNVGREGKSGLPQPRGGAEGQRPRVRISSARLGPVNLGGNKQTPETMMVRRKATRRIPRKDGKGFTSDTSPLDRQGSDRHPKVENRDTGEVPPSVDMPVPQARVNKPDTGATLPGKGNTLAGVSAEDLLGEEGKQLLENMRRREAAERQTQGDTRALSPGGQDSTREDFYSRSDAPADSDELAPQGNFLSGPTRRVERSTGPVERITGPVEQAPQDDDPVARESVAHDEMEMRAGHLLWLQGVITREEVEDAMVEASAISGPIQDLLANNTFADQSTLHRFLARHECIAPVDLDIVRPSERALAALRPSVARSYRVLPIEKLGELLIVAATFPFEPSRLLELRHLTSSKVKLYIAAEDELDAAIKKYYPVTQDTQRSPRPGGVDTPTGDALERRYDPTLSGEDSGLYTALDGPGSDVTAPDDVAMSELDESDPAMRDTVDNEALASGDLDESTLGQDYELADDESGSSRKRRSEGLDAGPEDHDPFAD